MNKALRNLIVLLCVTFAAAAAMGVDAPRYMSGGIGEAELAALRDREKDYNIKMIFSGADGAYLADVEVVIRDTQSGTVFAHKNLGPIVLIQLPAGGYEISAATREKSANRKVKLDAGQREELVFVLK